MDNKEIKKTLLLPKTDFPLNNFNHKEVEERIRKFWEVENIYEKRLESNIEKESFILHSGPTYANGKIHCGHVLNLVIKDIIVRFFSREKFAPYILGWDAHGLPIEHKILQEKGDDRSWEEVRESCRKFSEKQMSIQRNQMKKLGLMTNYNEYYVTTDKSYEAEQIRMFSTLVKKGVVYRGYKPIQWSWSHRTALAENEIEYINKKSKTLYFKLELEKESKILENNERKISFLAWTTQPWTIPFNRLLAINEGFIYCLVDWQKELLIIAKDNLSIFEKLGHEEPRLIKELLGKELLGLRYKNVYDLKKEGKDFYVTDDNENVKKGEGTGLVHIAPAFGLEDFNLAKKKGLEITCEMNEDGYFRKVESKEVNGKHFTELNEWVIKDLNSRKISLKETEIVHSYPHDWRDKKPLVYRLTKQWFIDLKKIRKEISENSKIVQWFPSWTEDKMESFIKNRQDWCISRQRCWGLPLPVLYKNKDEEILNAELIDYIADIIEVWGSGRWFNGEILKDIKKKFPEISNKGNISLSKEIMDVWFDSGVSHWCILEKKIIRRD